MQVLFEDNESINELKDFSIRVIQTLANENYKLFKQWAYSDEQRPKFLYSVLIHKVYVQSSKQYKKIDDFLNRARWLRAELVYDTGVTNGEYSYKESPTKDYILNIERTIKLFYNNSFLDDVKNIFNDVKMRNSANEVKLVFLMENVFSDTLLHELQHAYDDYRSNSKLFQTKQMKQFLKRAKEFKTSNDKSIKSIIQIRKIYFNLPHEIWARFSETVTKINYFKPVKIIDKNGNEYFKYKIIPLKDAYEKFKDKYKAFEELTEKNRRRITSAFVSFWHDEKDNVEKENKKEEKIAYIMSEEFKIRKIVKKIILKEIADYFKDDSGNYYTNQDKDAIPFLYYNNVLYIGDVNNKDVETHNDMMRWDKELNKVFEKFKKEYFKEKNIKTPTEHEDEVASYEAQKKILKNKTLSGRIWLDKKVIGFWEHPTKKQLQNVIQKINNKLNINIDGSWKIYDDEIGLVDIDLYSGGEISKEKEIEAEKLKSQHIASYRQRNVNKTYNKSFGSEHPKYKWNRELDKLYHRAQ